MGCCTTINLVTALHLLSIWNLIGWSNKPIPSKGSRLNLLTSGSNIQTVTSITPSKAKFLLFLYCTVPGLNWIRSFNVRSICQPEKRYWPELNWPRWLNNGYYMLKLEKMRWWFQQSTMIRNFGLIDFMDSSRFSNRLVRCILYLSEQLWDWHIWFERMLHQIESIAYGL